MTTDETTPIEAATAYFDTWAGRDFDAFEALLAPDVTFRGPLGRADDAASCRKGIEGMSQLMDGLEVHARAADGADVITWFHLLVDGDEVPIANWMQVEGGHIRRIRVTFNPRPLLAKG